MSATGERLKRLRMAKGLTQKQLAQPSYTDAYVSTIEAGKRTPSAKALAHFASRLGIGVDELLSGRSVELTSELELHVQDAHNLVWNGRHDDARRTFERVRRDANRLDLPRLQAKAHEGLGLITERAGNATEALAHYEKARRLLEGESPEIQTEAVIGIARCLQLTGDVRYAIHLIETQLRLVEREGVAEPTALMRLYSSLIWPYSEVGLEERAAEAAEQALRYQAHVADAEALAHSHINVARALLQQNRDEDALASLRRAEDLFRSLHSGSELARARLAQGIVMHRTGNLKGARAALEESVATFRETRDRLNEARALNELARTYRLSKLVAEARASAERSLSLMGDSESAETALSYEELGLAYAAEDPALAERYLRSAIAIYLDTDNRVQAALVMRELGDMLADAGDLSRAAQIYRDGLLALDPSQTQGHGAR